MVNDADLLALPIPAFEKEIEKALQLLENKPHLLAQARLADSSLLRDVLLPGEVLDSKLQGLGMRSLLRWAVEQLRPQGELQPYEPLWRSYLVLLWEYFEGQKVENGIDNQLGVQAKTVFNYRKQGIASVATILRHELQNKRNPILRQQFFIVERYRALTPNQQRILQLAAIFTQPLPLVQLQQLAQQNGMNDLDVSMLLTSGLLIRYGDGADITVPSSVRAQLL